MAPPEEPGLPLRSALALAEAEAADLVKTTKGGNVTIPRRELIDESIPAFYHISTRCVRRAFLCGKDSYTAKDYEL